MELKRKLKSKRIKLTCKRKICGYSWKYGGHAKFYACCPKCRTSVRLKQTKNSTRGVQDTKHEKK